jgi:glycine betaine/proline transport system permease protein
MIVRIEAALQDVPPMIMLVLLVLIAWRAAGRRVAILVAVCLAALGFLDPAARRSCSSSPRSTSTTSRPRTS